MIIYFKYLANFVSQFIYKERNLECEDNKKKQMNTISFSFEKRKEYFEFIGWVIQG